MAEGIMAVDAMGVDATKQESMVSLILSRPTGQDGGWFLIEGATDFVILQESFSPL
jgi:ribulose bisphosphate carboxylase small subunit